MTVEFCPWYSLAEADRFAPTAPGVYQIKLPHVIDYPTGKSAMIHYGAAVDLRAALAELSRRHGGSAWLARHQATTPEEGTRLLGDLVDRFRQRFGREPSLPAGNAGEPRP